MLQRSIPIIAGVRKQALSQNCAEGRDGAGCEEYQ